MYAQSQMNGKPNNLKVFMCDKTNLPKHNCKTRLKSYMSKGGKSWF
jgi:hypothetical protein